MVLTDSIAAAEGSSSSTSAMTSCFQGIDTAQPRMPRPRTPAIASTMPEAANAL